MRGVVSNPLRAIVEGTAFAFTRSACLRRFVMRTRIAWCLLFVSSIIVFAAAQQRADIKGVVLDSSGAALPGVRVTLNTSPPQSTVTNERGEFTFAQVPVGTYDASFELPGFKTLTERIVVTTRRMPAITVRMAVAALEESVSVVTESPSVDRRADKSARIGGRVSGVASGAGGGVAGGIAATAPPPAMPATPAPYLPGRYSGPMSTATYDSLDENPFRRVSESPVSTFSADVDTASYANVRRFLNEGSLPPPGAVRIEELINYFRFDYPNAANEHPFSVTTELADCPWNRKHRLALVGLHGRETPEGELPRRNLVFLIDVSGSMQPPDRLPLVRHGLRMFADTLTEPDRVAIVVYAGASGLVLPATSGDNKETIQRAIANLEAGGSTNGAAGITLAYQVARENFIRGGVNRVILATDGDFNVGVTSQDELVRLIERERASGVFLSVLGVGRDNLKDSTMEKLADKGNGNYSYLDSLYEARKVLVREGGGTLVTIAKDVKLQIEFNPAAVSAYRLIGYENRVLAREDFNDDKKDAGEIGAGHTVTALYEIVPVGVETSDVPSVDPLKYQTNPQPAATATSRELATLKLRYKAPDGDVSKLMSIVIRNETRPLSANLGFASAVAEFGMVLRQSKHAGSGSFATAAERARRFRGEDRDGYRAEFVKLVELARGLKGIETTRRHD
jgi:Ca-activated chloride channel family protein